MASSPIAQTSVVTDASTNTVGITVSTDVYPRPAVLGAAYVFIDRCFVWLDAPSASELTVSLRGRTPLDDTTLNDLAGEFANELLSQSLRQLLTEQSRPLLESIVGRAIAGAGAAAGNAEPEFDLAALEALELEDEPFDDPLGIAMSWEDKYGDKRPSKAKADAFKAAEASQAAATNKES